MIVGVFRSAQSRNLALTNRPEICTIVQVYGLGFAGLGEPFPWWRSRVLRAGGTLAIIETRRAPLGDRLVADLRRCQEQWEPDNPRKIQVPIIDKRADSLLELEASELFEAVNARRYEWEGSYTRSEYVDLALTFSNLIALPPDRQRGAVECIGDAIDRAGGLLTERCVNHLVLARRAPGTSEVGSRLRPPPGTSRGRDPRSAHRR